jgi:hypothetical protein
MTVALHMLNAWRGPGRALHVLALAMAASLPPGAAATAPACSAASGPGLVPLVELYTSEGCDSCPPADRWLATRFAPVRGATDVSVLAFHVDYWDRLGWKDRFADARYTERQYATMRANAATFVYTPQVVVQGRDAKGWQRGTVDGGLGAARKRPARATIAIDLVPETAATLAVRAEAKVVSPLPREDLRLWLAYTESGLVSDVKAGENRGVRLEHDHVVRALHGPYAFDAKGDARAVVTLRLPGERGTSAAVVAFVQDARNGDVLQTLTLAPCAAR